LSSEGRREGGREGGREGYFGISAIIDELREGGRKGREGGREGNVPVGRHCRSCRKKRKAKQRRKHSRMIQML